MAESRCECGRGFFTVLSTLFVLQGGTLVPIDWKAALMVAAIQGGLSFFLELEREIDKLTEEERASDNPKRRRMQYLVLIE